MNISELSVRRGVTFGMVYLIVLGFGLFSLSRLDLDLYPDITFPAVVIITGYTGANPQDVETLITRPIEGGVASVKGIEKITSDSKQGASMVLLEFDWSEDMEQAETDVRRNLDLIKGYLPDDADEPIVFAFDPSMQPIVMMMVTGPYPLDELRRLADDEIAPRLERLDGIAVAEAAGGLERQIRVILDPQRVQAFNLDVNRVVGAVFSENRQEPGGYVEQGSLEFAVQVDGKYQSVAEIGDIVVGSKVGPTGVEMIRLRDVAEVEDGFKESRRVLAVDGEPAVWMMVRKQSGANTVQASERVMDALAQVNKDLGGDLEFRVIFNQADYINESLGNLSTTAVVGVFITFLVLLGFLRNIRSSLIVATAIPLSVVATFAVMDQAGMTLNVLSLAGLALSVGMLVDNGIIVLENIFRMREEGRGAWDGAISGAKAVGMAVTASTLTTVAVFVPVLFVPGIAGVLFRDMAVTICFALIVSLVVARTFIPLSASRLLGSEKAERLLARAGNRTRFVRFRETYGRSLDWALAHRWVVGAVLVGVLAVTVVLARLLPTEFIMEGDNSFMPITVEAPVDSNLDRATEVVAEAVEAVKQVVPESERKMITTDVGTGEGFASIFSKGVHAGMIRVPLVKPAERERDKKTIEASVRDALAKVPGLTSKVGQTGGFSGGGDIDVQIRGYDLEVSREIGQELRDRFKAMPDISEATFSMEDQKPQLTVRFDREKMGRLGLSTASVGQAVTTAFMGRPAARYADGGDEYDVLVRYGKDFRKDADELRRLPVATPGGKVVPLGNVADIGMELGPVNITRLDQERVTTVSLTLAAEYADAAGKSRNKDFGATIGRVEKTLESYPWPDGFMYTIGGTAEDFQTSMKYLGLALLVSILLVYMVMASQFESLRQPFIVLFSVPLAGIGVVLAFVLTRSQVDMPALVGAIMLVGIVVNNAIIMIDAANQIRDTGVHAKEAIALAGRQRLRPVLMTAMTTIFGMTPMALGIGEGSEAWSGLAKAVIGGLISATFLTLYVVPTVYTLFAGRHRTKAEVAALEGIEHSPEPA
jgi:HAE1 family hydrophobic/amphiphilic exporter-1